MDRKQYITIGRSAMQDAVPRDRHESVITKTHGSKAANYSLLGWDYQFHKEQAKKLASLIGVDFEENYQC